MSQHDPPTYELEPDPDVPALPGEVILRRDIEGAYTSLAADLMVHAANCVRTFGDFHLALSGGSTPMPFYRKLMTDPAYRDFPWKRTHLWIVDERRVPHDDDRSNGKHIEELLVRHSGIPRSQAHLYETDRNDAAKRYEKQLRETLVWREKGHDRLDFVLLGMGDDCHTASLFPNSPAIHERDKLIVDNDGAGVTPPPRLTMTYKLLNGSRFLALLVTGKKKRDAIARAAGPERPASEIPVHGLRPVGGALRWYLDHDACP